MDTALPPSSQLPTPFAVPVRDQIEFARLGKIERLRINDLLAAFRVIDAAKGARGDAMKAIAAVNAGRRGFSVETLQRLYYKYRKSGYDWRAIMRKYHGSRPGKPDEFRRFFAGLVLKCQGRTDVIRAARDELIYNYWRAGKAVPGYGTFADFWERTQGGKPFPRFIKDAPPHTPEWSYRTLCRVVSGTVSKEIRAAAAHGDLIAHNYQMQLYRDRTGLRPLQYVTFDDVELDIECLCKIGNTYKVRPLQAVMALDIATAKFVGWNVRPMLKSEDMTYFPPEAGRVLTRKQVNATLMKVLLKCGLPEKYPMRLLLENASGTLNKADRHMIETMLPGRIVFESTRMFKESYLGMECKNHGLPYQKGFIESSFGGLHTRIAGLPGALAPRYEFRSPAAAALASDAMKVIETARAKGIAETLLKFKLLTYDEFLPIFDMIVERWNARTDHKLQGFGYEFETLVGSDFYPRETAVKMLSSEELESAKFIRRMESPEERWAKLAQGAKFTPVQVPALYPLLQQDKRIVTVRNGQIALEFSNISADKFYFRSDELRQHEGKEFIAVTPDRETLYLFRRNEGFVCAVPRLGRVPIIDHPAIVRQSGIVDRARKAQHKRVHEFLADRKNAFAEIDVHNAAILADNANIGTAMAVNAEYARRKKRKSQRALNDFADSAELVGLPAPARGEDDLSDFSDINELI